jgi:carboxylesterase type B
MDFISEPFLPQNPEELLRSGQINTDVEVIIGTNSDEGLILLLG